MPVNPNKHICARPGCKKYAIKGGTVCNMHGGTVARTRIKAAIRYEIESWKLGDSVDDPGTVLLRLITQSRRRADLYASLLEEAFAGTGTSTADPGGILLPKGVAALIGHKYTLNKDGERIPVEETVRGLVILEAEERDRCAGFCIKAIAAGLAERVVRLQEREATLAHEALLAGLDAAGITGQTRMQVLAGTASHLRSVS
jgi:hypothetical protein